MIRLISLFFIFSAFCAWGAQNEESVIEKMERYHDLAQSMVQGSLDSRGLSLDTLLRPNVPSYQSIQVKIDNDLKESSCLTTDCPDYFEELAKVSHALPGKAQDFSLLPNAQSFKMRRDLIQKAKKSIYIFVWAIYQDDAGWEFHDLVLEALRVNPQLDIRIIVDGIMVNVYGKKILESLEDASGGKIKIMKWKSRKYRASGTHRKMIIIDSEHVITGGMNIGNNYAHQGKHQKWRDLDLYLRGKSSAINAENIFVKIWNKQVEEFPKLKKRLPLMHLRSPIQEEEGAPVIFVDQHPGSAVKEAYHNIHTALVKLFRTATTSVDIETAYFIMDPIIKSEIGKMMRRGVKVRIFTNSDSSVDEPIISMAIMHSAREAVALGAQVYLRQLTMLHSKYMVVDGKISVIGSFNFHPRSLRFDAENVAIISDLPLAETLTEHFNKAIKEEKFMDNPDHFKINWNLMNFLTQSFYFDFL